MIAPVSAFALAVIASAPTVVRLPAGEDVTAARSLADEAFLAREGALLADERRMLGKTDAARLQATFEEAYRELKEETGRVVPTPALMTVAGKQTPGGFDLVVFRPPGAVSDAAVVFLHGYGGNWTLPCSIVARAAADVGVMTVCPSHSVGGHWDTPDGRAIVEQTRAYLGALGVRRFVLAGLSNGGVGASQLAARGGDRWKGVVAISGVAFPGPALPMLVVIGTSDTMATASVARAFVAQRSGRELLELAGDHFVLASERARIRPRMSAFFARALAIEAAGAADDSKVPRP